MNKKPVVDPRMCPAHRIWMRKGQCEICRLNSDKKQREAGYVQPTIKIGKL